MTTPEETYTDDQRNNVLMRGLAMLVFAVLFAIAETVLFVLTVLQFGWMLFAREKNKAISDFGEKLAPWLAAVAKFQTGSTEKKPFPWS
ncbi:MAG: DUF4389 domain-containing protein [Rhodobacteraceae bacterium]|nr:DUF4389 domain-containing protein [Paracoccaceae bacterium]